MEEKLVLSGNEAIARGAYDAGVRLVSSYPGTPSTEITENMSKYLDIHVEWATNEKVATEVALGASLAGARAITAMKHVGLNVAADPVMTASYTGVTGGFVVVVADDPNMHSSQNEQDSRHYARLSKIPMLEPASGQEAYDYSKLAFEISEKFSTPVFLRSSTRLSHSMTVVKCTSRVEKELIPYKKDTDKWVMTPANARRRHVVVEQRVCELSKDVYDLAKVYPKSSDIGIICAGVAYQYVAEAMPEVSILKLGMVYPLPVDKIAEFAKTVKKLYVLEELDKFIETEIKAAGIKVEELNRSVLGELSVEKVLELFGRQSPQTLPLAEKVPVRPPNLCAGCSHRGMYYAINKLKLNVSGDIGCYTLGYMPPLSSVDSCVCMGASVSMAHGFERASGGALAKNSVAVIGDSTFLHTGLNGLVNSVYNGGASTVIILDNRITGMTGHQPNPASGKDIHGNPAPAIDFETLCRAVGVKNIVKVDPFDVDKCIEVLKAETAREEVSVIITTRPCIFADKLAIKAPYKIEEHACKSCKACLRLGCPAISWNVETKKAAISAEQCTGCGLCPKVCKFDAIEQVG